MKNLLILFIILISITGCKKQQPDFCKEGYIYWGGDPAVDGLGWYFAEGRTSAGMTFYQIKDSELNNEYKNYTDSVAVHICLRKTNERAPCFCAASTMYYHVISIKKR
jgi:hypothetical protein